MEAWRSPPPTEVMMPDNPSKPPFKGVPKRTAGLVSGTTIADMFPAQSPAPAKRPAFDLKLPGLPKAPSSAQAPEEAVRTVPVVEAAPPRPAAADAAPARVSRKGREVLVGADIRRVLVGLSDYGKTLDGKLVTYEALSARLDVSTHTIGKAKALHPEFLAKLRTAGLGIPGSFLDRMAEIVRENPHRTDLRPTQAEIDKAVEEVGIEPEGPVPADPAADPVAREGTTPDASRADDVSEAVDATEPADGIPVAATVASEPEPDVPGTQASPETAQAVLADASSPDREGKVEGQASQELPPAAEGKPARRRPAPLDAASSGEIAAKAAADARAGTPDPAMMKVGKRSSQRQKIYREHYERTLLESAGLPADETKARDEAAEVFGIPSGSAGAGSADAAAGAAAAEPATAGPSTDDERPAPVGGRMLVLSSAGSHPAPVDDGFRVGVREALHRTLSVSGGTLVVDVREVEPAFRPAVTELCLEVVRGVAVRDLVILEATPYVHYARYTPAVERFLEAIGPAAAQALPSAPVGPTEEAADPGPAEIAPAATAPRRGFLSRLFRRR